MLLAEADLPPSSLRLEITETTLMRDPGHAAAVLDALATAGVRVSIDDFGTGHSSLAVLQRLPIEEIKIDRSFVRDRATSAADAAIVRSTVDLAHNLGKSVVAEGVEDAVTLDLLRGLGCHAAQGYLLSRPVPAAELTEWLGERRGRAHLAPTPAAAADQASGASPPAAIPGRHGLPSPVSANATRLAM